MKLHQRLRILADGRGVAIASIAGQLGCTDEDAAALLEGRRQVTPRVLEDMLDALGLRLPGARRDFHRHAAVEAGWKIDP